MVGSRGDVVDAITGALGDEIPGLRSAASELARRAVRLAAMLDDVLAECLAPHNLTPADYGVLITLRTAGREYRLRPGELRSKLLMTSGGVSGVLNRLERSGLVRRQPHATDGRSSWVQLTAEGAAAADAAARAWTEAQCDALRAVPEPVSRAAADSMRAVLLALGDGGTARRGNAAADGVELTG